MTERFEVGQKIRHSRYGEGSITYGPYRSTFGDDAYLVRREDGIEKTWFGRYMEALPEPAQFAVGDKARGTSSGIVYTVEAGPIEGTNGVWYVTRRPDGDVCINPDRHLEHIVEPEPIKVGDRVRVVKDDDHTKSGEFVGRTGVVRNAKGDGWGLPYRVRLDDPRGTWDDGSWWVAEVERIDEPSADTYEHDGVTYDLSARYLDRDEDYWMFKRVDGEVRGHCAGTNRDTSEYIGQYSDTLAEAVRDYGPLTRVND